MKATLFFLVILLLGGLIPVALTGCGRSATGSLEADTSTRPALPVLDTMPHGTLETAYFAMG